MAAVAGALDIQLEKVGNYKLGKAVAVPEPAMIDDSVRLMLIATFAWVVFCLIIGGIRLAFAA